LAEDAGLTIAIKPHVGSALNEPRFCRELIEAVDSPRVRLAYDYSHFDQRGFDLVETTRDLAPLSVFVHVKDRAPGEEKVRFVLPGQGQIDYPLLLKTLHAAGYRGAVVVEVSAQIHSQPGYSAKEAASTSFGHLSRALVAAGITAGS
jgi:inosose dehydratase